MADVLSSTLDSVSDRVSIPPVTGGGGAGTGIPSAGAWGAVAGGEGAEGAGGAPGARGAGGASSAGAIRRIKSGLSHGFRGLP